MFYSLHVFVCLSVCVWHVTSSGAGMEDKLWQDRLRWSTGLTQGSVARWTGPTDHRTHPTQVTATINQQPGQGLDCLCHSLYGIDTQPLALDRCVCEWTLTLGELRTFRPFDVSLQDVSLLSWTFQSPPMHFPLDVLHQCLSPNSITPTFTETSPQGKLWTQIISTCRDGCDTIRDKSVTNPFVSL